MKEGCQYRAIAEGEIFVRCTYSGKWNRLAEVTDGTLKC
jgi:hypothetical protein